MWQCRTALTKACSIQANRMEYWVSEKQPCEVGSPGDRGEALTLNTYGCTYLWDLQILILALCDGTKLQYDWVPLSSSKAPLYQQGHSHWQKGSYHLSVNNHQETTEASWGSTNTSTHTHSHTYMHACNPTMTVIYQRDFLSLTDKMNMRISSEKQQKEEKW